jgi:hypothetical protein
MISFPQVFPPKQFLTSSDDYMNCADQHHEAVAPFLKANAVLTEQWLLLFVQ